MVKKPTDNDSPKAEESTLESIKDNSLKTAGYAYLAGDAALFAAGMARGDKGDLLGGLTWGIGGLAAARYGNPSSDKMLDLLSGRLSNYLKEQGVDIPKEPSTALLTKDRGVIDHIEQFLYTHPSETLNAAYILGGAQMISAGLGKGEAANKWSAVSGALVVAGALAGLLIKQKEKDPDKPAKGMVGKAMAWAHEKPLRISGIAYALNNVSLILGGLQDRKTHPGNISSTLKFATAGTYLFGNSMLALSSKGHEDNKHEGNEALQKLADGAAHVVAVQPKPVQDALIERISGYLADQPESQMKADTISTMLHAKLAEISKNIPQTSNAQWQHTVTQTESPSLSL